MAYSDRELLLLSNFVYIPACMSSEPIGQIIDHYRDENGGFSAESVAGAAYGGGMRNEDVATVFEKIDEQIKEDPDFGCLSASRTLEEYDVRAVCYTGVKDNDPVVAFRGTGGTRQAWSDNFEGAFCPDTKIQRIADDFLAHECAIYDDITVTGHSKGGNLAQYVTVKQGERISACTSFDGQGFPEVFCKAYTGEIKTAAPKIRSVSAYNDFVNILLTCIAGESIYIANKESAAAAHSSVTLLTENEFDEDGNIISIRDQGLLSKQLGRFTDRAVNALSQKDGSSQAAFSAIMGSAISLALTTPTQDIKEDAIAPALGLMAAQFVKDIAKAEKALVKDVPLAAQSVSINTRSCRESVCCIEDESRRIENIVSRITRIREELAYSITAKICAERALENICEDLMYEARKLAVYASTADLAIGMYEKTERELALLMDS